MWETPTLKQNKTKIQRKKIQFSQAAFGINEHLNVCFYFFALVQLIILIVLFIFLMLLELLPFHFSAGGRAIERNFGSALIFALNSMVRAKKK